MKILYKINLLILISILALIGISVTSSGFKKQELKFYILVEDVKRLQVNVLNALVHEKNFEKTYKDETLVFTSLDNANRQLDQLEVVLLQDNQKTEQIKKLLVKFRSDFTKMIQNSKELLSIKAKINGFARDYSTEHFKADNNIQRMIADSLLYEKKDVGALQELKNSSLTAFSYVSEIIILINQDLILGIDISGFDEKYKKAMLKLTTQEKNLRYQVVALKEDAYKPLSKQLTLTFNGLSQQVPFLQQSFIHNVEISKQLQDTENQISVITESITRLSESIRIKNSKKASLLQGFGQSVLIGFLLIGGVLLGRSITKPLTLLTRATVAMQPDSDAMVTDSEEDGLQLDTTRNDELGQLGKSFSKMRDAIQQKIVDLEELNKKIEKQNLELIRIDKLKSQILDNTSHELRTPLNGIIGIAESLIDGVAGNLGKKVNHNLSLIASSGRRLANLVNDILDFSKLGQKKIELKRSTFHIRDLIEVVLTISKPLISPKELLLVNAIDPDLPAVDGDENRVQQILYNLIGNAIKFTREGEIIISAEVMDSFLEISVADTGIGISPEEQQRIFNAFEQADGSIEREYGGTGLGLSITKKLVEIHNGSIRVESDKGRGSVFKFTLPISNRQPDKVKDISVSQNFEIDDPILDTNEDLEYQDMDQSNFHILVVDDEPVNLQAVTNQLMLKNYRSTSVSDGIQALEVVEKQGKPDLILLDIMMPKMSGYDVCKRLREQYSPSELPIIMLTAKNQVSDLVAGFECGTNDYLAKPFSKKELMARINSHLILSQAMIEQKKAQNALRESQEKYQALTQNANDAIFVVKDGLIIFANPKTFELFDYSEAELFDIRFEHLIHQKDKYKVIDPDGEMIINSEILDMNSYRVCNKSGEELWVQASCVDISWEKASAKLNILRDITILKKMETQLLQSSKLEAVGTLAGGIAHDFNNILFPVLGHIEMLQQDIPEDSPIQDRLKKIFAGAIRARDLVKQILAFSRQDNYGLELVDLSLVIKEALKLIRSTIPTSIEIRQDISNYCRNVKADPSQIHQIVMNITTNAYHAMEKTGGKLKVSLKEVELGEYDIITPDMIPGSYACLTVADTGIGMTKEVKDKIFDPFFTTKEKGKGTGMGLAVVHGIVNSMNGAILVYSEPDQGTYLHVYLPVVKSSTEQQKAKIDEPIPEGFERILLVDDEDAVIAVENEMLTYLGYHVTSYTNSMEALEAFRASPDNFDLIITDMAMPNMSGDKLSAELVKIHPDIPILLCTGFSEAMSEEKALSLGIKGFLMKPIIVKELANKIRDVLENKKKHSADKTKTLMI